MVASKREDLTGRTFGELFVVEYSHNVGRSPYWKCRCSCGSEKIIQSSSLKSGSSRTCGHWKADFLKARKKHGLYGTKLYRVWGQMIQRCTNENHTSYEHYGARGVSVCVDWLDFANFRADMESGYADGLTLDRKDNNAGYSKENCRWASRRTQILNRRPRSEWKNGGRRSDGVRVQTPKGEMNLLQASRDFGINYGTLRKRLARGMTIEQALLTPVGGK